LKGTTIEDTIIGGPAFTSLSLGRGDVLLNVDGNIATEQNIEMLLIGDDKPGSIVVLTVARGGHEVINPNEVSILFD
jgi:S1-C subfamily serine protease